MERIRLIRTTEHEGRPGIGALAAEAFWTLAATELLLLSFLAILEDEFPAWVLGRGEFWQVQCFLVLTVVLFGIAAPAAGRYRLPVCAGLETGYLLAGGVYVFHNMERLQKGLAAMSGDYLRAWNAYYKTNYYLDEPHWSEIGFALSVVVLLLLFLFFLLRYLVSLRVPMLLLPLVALVLGLLVDVLPEWRGLALYLAGAALLCAGPWDLARLRFTPAKENDVTKARRSFGGLVAAALVACLVLLATGLFFGGIVERIPEKTPEFLAFQQELEERVQSLGSSFASPNREDVDNSTPEYQNELILEIAADGKPDTNLYLADFYSGSYLNGRWKQDKRDFRRATKADGVDANRLGTLLRQMGYEYGSMNWGDSETCIGQIRNYRIDYRTSTNRALLPYFSDVADIGDDVWVEDEGQVKKRRFVDSVAFSGGGRNTDVPLYASFYGSLSETGENADGEDWYSAYAQEHYTRKSGLPAVEREAEWIQENLTAVVTSYYIDWAWPVITEDNLAVIDFYEENTRRLKTAELVRERLSELAEYNLYLDDIPAGTDTVQYFLETGHEGYCVHFASAGTLILQELGIPARYASGYIVKRNAFVEQADSGEYLAPVYDRNGHAWVEIYLENLGWVPFDMTPGYGTYLDELPTDEGNQTALQGRHNRKAANAPMDSEAAQEPESETESEASETESESETETQKDSEEAGVGGNASGEDAPNGAGSGGRALIVVGIVLVVLALLVLVPLLIRLALRCYRGALQQELRGKQYRRAVRRINRRLYRRLQKVWWSGMTDAEYERKLAVAYPDIPPEDWKRYMEVVKKVAFSEEEVSEEEMELCVRVYRGE